MQWNIDVWEFLLGETVEVRVEAPDDSLYNSQHMLEQWGME